MIRNCFSVFFAFLFLLSCNEESDLPNQKDSIRNADSIFQFQKNHRDDSIEASTDSLWTDTLNWQGTKIDSAVPVFGNINLLEQFGEPDSIKVFGNDCGSPLDWLDKKHPADSVWYYYYPGIIFYSNRYQYLLSEIDLTNHQLQIPRLNLIWNKDKTEAAFTREFPRSARNARLNPISTNSAEKTFKISYRNKDDCWILTFQNGKLKKVKIWWLLC